MKLSGLIHKFIRKFIKLTEVVYHMLNKNSLVLLKKGAVKQSRIKRIEAPVRVRAQPVVK